jgi:F-type H+-transporting ATPase subunit delta
MADPKDIKLAKRLAQLVIQSGEKGVEELRPALEKILAGRSASDTRAFLKAFHKAARREIQKDTLVIESTKPIEPEVLAKLLASFSEGRDRPLHIVQKSSPELIAGIRVQLGDTVYDASLANKLQSLAARIH